MAEGGRWADLSRLPLSVSGRASDEIGEAGRRRARDALDIAGWPGTAAGGDGLGEQPEHVGVVRGNTRADASLDPGFAVDVVVLDRLAGLRRPPPRFVPCRPCLRPR